MASQTASAHDVAAYIVGKIYPLSAMRLQKLVYYAQAWSLVWDDRALFSEPIQAWRDGPVVYDLWQQYKGNVFVTKATRGNVENLDRDARETIDGVLKVYGHLDAGQLSALTHREDPWLVARGDTPPNDPSSAEITLESMMAFYSALN